DQPGSGRLQDHLVRGAPALRTAAGDPGGDADSVGFRRRRAAAAGRLRGPCLPPRRRLHGGGNGPGQGRPDPLRPDPRRRPAARRLLASARTVGRYGGGPFQLADAKLPDGTPILVGRNASGDNVAVLERYGYLYLRLAGASDPAVALRTVAALPPDKGLAADP